MTTPDSLAGQRILIVEDEAMISMLIEDIIEELGCRVVGPAARVEHALTVLETNEVDGAVLDINLDGQLSYRIADALAQRNLPFLFVTGYGEAGVDAAYRDRSVVQKPFTGEALGRALRALMLTR